jgi:hypothetical protein
MAGRDARPTDNFQATENFEAGTWGVPSTPNHGGHGPPYKNVFSFLLKEERLSIFL